MTKVASQITSLTVVCSIVYSEADQRKHQSSASLALVRVIHRDRWIPRTKGQWRGKCFHLMTSSWLSHCYLVFLNIYTCVDFYISRETSPHSLRIFSAQFGINGKHFHLTNYNSACFIFGIIEKLDYEVGSGWWFSLKFKPLWRFDADHFLFRGSSVLHAPPLSYMCTLLIM